MMSLTFNAKASSLLLIGLLAACGGPAKRSDTPASFRLQSSELGDMRNVSAIDGFWIGGLPTVEDLDLAGRRGIVRVIDLRVPGEVLDYDLRAECARLGLGCVSINLRAADDLPDSAVDVVLQGLSDPERHTLMFSGDGSRCAMFFAIHRVVQAGLDLEEGLYEARCAGMQPGGPEDFVRSQVTRLGGAGTLN
ncbi:MAG: protein tyrosine phosphatase (PTP) superfamily phosphohydrolase (DUF442 family) [Chlamydiales bacterium]|jgi:protein tyrosine phosphatase (PTP) superfamily phosphohydrolase (DUF442 family)